MLTASSALFHHHGDAHGVNPMMVAPSDSIHDPMALNCHAPVMCGCPCDGFVWTRVPHSVPRGSSSDPLSDASLVRLGKTVSPAKPNTVNCHASFGDKTRGATLFEGRRNDKKRNFKPKHHCSGHKKPVTAFEDMPLSNISVQDLHRKLCQARKQMSMNLSRCKQLSPIISSPSRAALSLVNLC